MEQGYKNSGGWRFGGQMPGGILDLLKQYDPYAPGQDWSGVANVNVPKPAGALDKATQAKDIGAMATYGGTDLGGPGGDTSSSNSGGIGGQSVSPGGNSMTMASPAGLNMGMNAVGQGNMPGLLGMLGLNIGKNAPVFDLDASAISQVDGRENGMGMFGNDAMGQAVNPGEGFAGLGHAGYGGFGSIATNSDGMAAGPGGESVSVDGGVAAGPGGESVSTDGAAYAKGGKVKGLLGMDPLGPDDGFGALDRGEFIIKKNKAKKIGDKKLEALNKGKAKVVMDKGPRL